MIRFFVLDTDVYNRYDSKWELEGIYISGNDGFHYAWIRVPPTGEPVMLKRGEFEKFINVVEKDEKVKDLVEKILRVRSKYKKCEDVWELREYRFRYEEMLSELMNKLAKEIGYDKGWSNGYVYNIWLKDLEFEFIDQSGAGRVFVIAYPYSLTIDWMDAGRAFASFIGFLMANRGNYVRMLMKRGVDVSDLIYDEDEKFWW